jgi:hypothetical protein
MRTTQASYGPRALRASKAEHEIELWAREEKSIENAASSDAFVWSSYLTGNMIDCGTDWLAGSRLSPKAIVLTHAHPTRRGDLRTGPVRVYATEATWQAGILPVS